MRFKAWIGSLNISIILIPFLILYFAIVILAGDPVNLSGDEGRYLLFANNILNGFYSPSYPNINLWNGPGYPLFISTFLAFDLSLQVIRLVNGVLLYFCLIITYKTIILFCNRRDALVAVVLLGSFFPAYLMLRYLLTESLAWFLVSVISYSLVRYLAERTNKFLLLSAAAIGFLAMVKVIFGYVILVMILISGIMYLLNRSHIKYLLSFKVMILALVIFAPYILYTWQLTGKYFYLTNAGGMSLYTMSTPYEGEFGDWINEDELKVNRHHRTFMDSIIKLPPIERDEAFRSAAIQNIKSHPRKFLINCIANISRLFFEYPFSYKPARVNTLFYIVPGMFVLVPLFFTLLIVFLFPSRIPQELMILTLFMSAYLSGSVLVSAYSRMFYITLPFWSILIVYVMRKVLRISLNRSLS